MKKIFILLILAICIIFPTSCWLDDKFLEATGYYNPTIYYALINDGTEIEAYSPTILYNPKFEKVLGRVDTNI